MNKQLRGEPQITSQNQQQECSKVDSGLMILKHQQQQLIRQLYMFSLQQSFSPRLLYSLTAESLALAQLAHLQQQTELLRQLAARPQRGCEEKEVDATVDETHCQLETSTEEAPSQERVSLLADCRIRRTQEDEVLGEIQRKCSTACFLRVKEVFEGFRQQSKSNRQLEGELELSRKLNDSLLHFRQENEQLRVELERSLSAVAGKQEERDRMRVLEERNMNKEASVLKSEKNLLLKEKRIIEMRKKTQGIFEGIGREVSLVTKEITLFLNCYRETCKTSQIDKCGPMEERAQAVMRLWEQFERSFRAKLQ